MYTRQKYLNEGKRRTFLKLSVVAQLKYRVGKKLYHYWFIYPVHDDAEGFLYVEISSSLSGVKLLFVMSPH